MSYRTQQGISNSIKSEPLTISYGVPQGSIRGPQMFLIFNNDLCELIIEGNIVTYTDDTVILCKAD